MVALHLPEVKPRQFDLLYLRSDSTTVPLADAKLSGPARVMLLKKVFKKRFFELIEE